MYTASNYSNPMIRKNSIDHLKPPVFEYYEINVEGKVCGQKSVQKKMLWTVYRQICWLRANRMKPEKNTAGGKTNLETSKNCFFPAIPFALFLTN